MNIKDNCCVCIHCKRLVCANEKSNYYKTEVSNTMSCDKWKHWASKSERLKIESRGVKNVIR